MEPIEQVRQAANIIEIASQYTSLIKKGNKHVGLCPFHSEKTPSFTIDEDKQLYHCFGCGEGGDIFTLVMEKENLSFPEALRYLAEKYNINLPEKRKRSPRHLRLEEKIYSINEKSLAFFVKNLHNTEEGKKALQYLSNRGIDQEAIQKLKIGYAMNSWDSMISFFQKQSISPAEVEKAGLALPRTKSEGHYDRFRGRIIFPIFNLAGKVVAFGGRSIFDQDPKYLNSPDTAIYTKGDLLYGLNFCKHDIREKKEMILVEGYTDFLSLFQAGVTNTAASLGTSLTANQTALALRFAPRLIICYDGDIAGEKAARRAISLGLKKGLQIKIMVLPQGYDPDSFITKNGVEKFLSLAKNSITGLKFLIDMQLKGYRKDIPEEKVKIVREIIKEIENIPDAIISSEYIKQTGEYLGIDENLLRATVQYKPSGEKQVVQNSFLPAEKRLLQIIFTDSQIASSLFKEISPTDLQGIKSEPIFSTFQDYFQNGNAPDFFQFKEKIDPALFSFLSEVLLEESNPPTIEEARDCLSSLRQISLTNQLTRLKSQIPSLIKRKELDKIPSIQKKIMDINRHLYKLSQREYGS